MVTKTVLDAIRFAKGKAFNWADITKSRFQSVSEAQYDREHIGHFLDSNFKLTSGEKEQIKHMYGGIIPCISRGYDFFHAMKQLDKFDVNYIPSSYYYPYMLRELNPEKFKKLMCNKSLIKLIYQNGVLQPETPLRSIAGVYFNSENKPITTDEAMKIIERIDSPILFKPSTDTNSGIGIKFIEKDHLDDLCQAIHSRSVVAFDSDFVIQLPVEQSEETRIFNPTSLNCMRITTLNLNGEVSAHSLTLKCGPRDSKVDNIGSGKRGVIIGVSSDGHLASYGFYGNGEKVKSHNQILFEGKRIPSFNKVIQAAINLHKVVESCHVIGWDMALDASGNAVLIEGNTNYPGISLEQMCSGPVFGDRTEEVITYVSENKRIKGGSK